jgi:hypothetical protein
LKLALVEQKFKFLLIFILFLESAPTDRPTEECFNVERAGMIILPALECLRDIPRGTILVVERMQKVRSS